MTAAEEGTERTGQAQHSAEGGRPAFDPDWLVPDWPAPAGVHALCTTRAGGHSEGAWGSLNLGDHVADNAVDVAANRSLVQAAIGVRPVFMKQVHGNVAAQLDGSSSDGLVADSCATTLRGVACAIMVADCLPVLLACEMPGNPPTRAVAAAHAGWRGLAGGAVESALDAMAQSLGQPRRLVAAHTVAWLGPCIGPHEFEVGDEVRAAFADAHETDIRHFVRGSAGALSTSAETLGKGKWLADLQGLARARLTRVGIDNVWGNDGSDAWCTVRNPSRFFSYRASGTCGRFAAFVWLD